MRRSLFALGIAALAAFVGALVMLETHEDKAPVGAPETASVSEVRAPRPARSPPPARQAQVSEEPSSPPPGFKLGKGSGPNARSNAQAILDNSLAELRRLGPSHQTLARDVYMRGHSAAERVEDELGDDDEPGLAQLRTQENAMKTELRRIYGARDSTARP